MIQIKLKKPKDDGHSRTTCAAVHCNERLEVIIAKEQPEYGLCARHLRKAYPEDE